MRREGIENAAEVYNTRVSRAEFRENRKFGKECYVDEKGGKQSKEEIKAEGRRETPVERRWKQCVGEAFREPKVVELIMDRGIGVVVLRLP